MWRDVPSHGDPSLTRPYYLIKQNRLHEITLACFVQKTRAGEDDLYRYCDRFEFVRANQLKGISKGFRVLVSKFNYQNIFSRDFNIIRVYSSEMRKKVANLVKSGTFDIVYADQAMYPYVHNIRPRMPVVLEFFSPWLHLLRQSYLNEQSILGKFNYLAQYYSFRLEVPGYTEFDAGIYVTKLHERLSGRFVPKKTFIIPPPIDLEYFKPIGGASASPCITFTGQMSYFVNIHSMHYFCSEVFPLIRKQISGARLCIVGRSPPESIARLANSSVTVTGEVKDIRPSLTAADVVIAPITIDDGGIKTKVLEAMAMGKTVVSTPLGAQGIGATHLENILIAGDSRDFAAWVVTALRDASLRERIGTRAREFVGENYSQQKMTRRLDDMFVQVAGSRQSDMSSERVG